MFPDGDALGKVITSGGDQAHNTIVGIADYMHTPYDDGASGMEYRILFFPGRPGGAGGMSYLVRAEPGSYAELFTDLEERLATVNAERIITTRSLMEIKLGGQFVNRFIVQILSTLGVLLLSVTALGIYGMTSFTVTQRTHQIGTRRALGARKIHIVRFFMVENAIITLLGIGVGLVLAFALNAAIVSRGPLDDDARHGGLPGLLGLGPQDQLERQAPVGSPLGTIPQDRGLVPGKLDGLAGVLQAEVLQGLGPVDWVPASHLGL